MLKIFQATGPRGPSFTVRTLLGPVTAPTREELDTRIAELRAKMAKVMGREPTDDEFTRGVAKLAPTAEQISEARKAKASAAYAERIASEALHDPTADRLRTAQERAETERRAGLTAAQRELEDAQIAAQAAEQRREDQQRLAEVMATASYRTLREALDNSLLIAKLDESISQDVTDVLTSQIAQLERTGDTATVRSNLSEVQRAIAEQTAIQDAQLREAVSRSEMKRRMLSSASVFDSVDVELVGSLPFVCLTVNGVTKKISQSAYDSRTSDEQLKSQLFGGGESNV